MQQSSSQSPCCDRTTLLGEDEPPVFERVNAEAQRPVLLICDHASNRVPRGMNRLGLDDRALSDHIAWDPGAALVTRHLSDMMQAPAVLASYSRLVIDVNRQPGDPSSIPTVSDNVVVPGNHGLDEAACEARVATFFRPYHDAIDGMLSHLWHLGVAPALVSVHSFTPVMAGFQRPWHVGILWNRDGRIAQPLIQALSAYRDLCVGDNEPYSGRSLAFSIDRHGGAAGLPHVGIEIRQDLLADETGCLEWAEILHAALTPILATPGLHRVEHF